MAALKRSLAQIRRQSGQDGQAKASQAHSRSGPALIASTDSRRPKKEGGGRDRAGSRRHEPQRPERCQTTLLRNGSRWVLLSTRRLWRRTKHSGVALGPALTSARSAANLRGQREVLL